MAQRLLPWRHSCLAACSTAGAMRANGSSSVPQTSSAGLVSSRFKSVEVQKPTTDYRIYRSAQLPNNLRVMLVSDAKCDRAAAAMSVKIGSISDPQEVPGLAHFCEHMLFLGTEKFPAEDEYSRYLAMHGGESNAYTAETVTNYYFSVKPEALDGALDRFAQFFVSPLFTESATERELQAIDSEHSKNLQQDGWRLSQLLRNAANPAHPLNHFMTGSSETLRDEPSRQGVDVRAALLDFHGRYYSANLMCLVVVGRESPEELLRMAEDHFAAVPDCGASVPHGAEIGSGHEAFPLDRLARCVRVVPIRDARSLTFQFVLPGQRELWRSKPTSYLAHLIGHEGQGSLLTALKQRGLATELTAGGALEEAGVHVFAVTVMLTEAGEANVGAVGDLVFAFIQLLREAGPSEPLWRELQQLSDLGFRFRSLANSTSTASGLAHSLQEHDEEFALSAGSCLWEYDPAQIIQLLNMLDCQHLRLVLMGKTHADACDCTERWYGTRYSDKPLAAELRARWEAAPRFPDLRLPAPNPFVPEDLRPKPLLGAALPEVPELLLPQLASELPAVRGYYRKDEEFGLPKAVCGFQLYCPHIQDSVANVVLAELWCMAVAEELNEFAYEAQVAGLSYSLRATSLGLAVSVGGYNDKLPSLLTAVAERMASLSEVSEQTYSIVRTILERDYANAALRSTPYQQALSHEGCVLHRPAYSYQERLQALRAVDGCKSLGLINQRLLERCHVECLLQGNLTTEEARALVHSFIEPLRVQDPLRQLPPVGTAALCPGWTLMVRQGTNPDERNGAVVVTLQAAEYSLESHGLVALANQILGQRFFDELRTKQQLGYIVAASPYAERHSFVGMRFIVQSEKPPAQVADRVKAWLEWAWGHLEQDLQQGDFERYQKGLVARLRERPKSLGEEFGRNWAEVASRNFSFRHRETLAERIEGTSLAELQRFTKEKFRVAPALCVVVCAPSSERAIGTSDVAAHFGVKCNRHWSHEEVESFRSNADWRFRPAEVDCGSAATSRL